MDFSYSEEQKMLAESAKRFFQRECPKSFVKKMAADEKGYSPEMWRKMANLGWLGLVFDKEYGGSEGTFMDLFVLLQEMGRAVLPSPFFSTVVMGGITINECGTKENRERYLPSITRGDSIITVAILEESGRYSIEEIETRVERMKGRYHIYGTKLFVPDAQVAHRILSFARTPEGITIFVVERDTQNLLIMPLRTLSGEKLCEVVFNGVEVTQENIVGEVGHGWEVIETVWPKWVVSKCAEMVGACEQVLDMTVQYAKERHQFGQPLAAFQIVQHHCVDMAIDLEISKYLTGYAAWRLSQGFSCRKEAAMAKACCGDVFKRVALTAQQIHGGMGFTEEHDLHLYYKRAKTWEVMLGDSDFHRDLVFQEMGF